jgi:hypothetical protein
LRHALGCGSTTNSVVSNLGAEALIAYHQIQSPEARECLRTASFACVDFLSARQRIARQEAPGVRQRSMVRHLHRHLGRLRRGWFCRSSTDANA